MYKYHGNNIYSWFRHTGAAIGSFLNVVIDRLPAGKSIAYPPSSCDACQHRLSWPDLFPVFSYLFLRGRCRYCKAKIPQRVFWVELGTGLLTGYLFLSVRLDPDFAGDDCLLQRVNRDRNESTKRWFDFPAIVFPVALVALVVNFFIPNLFSWHNFLFGLIGAAFGSIFCYWRSFCPRLSLKRKAWGWATFTWQQWWG